MAEDKRRRSAVNVKRLTMWKMKDDTSEETTYEAEPYTWDNSLASAKYTPKMQQNSQYGDGIKVEDFVAKDGGDLNITVNGFEHGDGAYLFGETDKNGTEVSNAKDIVPNQCVAYYTVRSDGKLNLYKYPKATFYPEGEDAQQQEGTTIKYGTAALKGAYMPLISNGDDMYKRRGVDPVKDKDLIERWFTDPKFAATEESDSYSAKQGEGIPAPTNADDDVPVTEAGEYAD